MIYICGDSFAVSDPDYGPCWVDLLQQQLSVTSLAQVCASNLMISMQVDYALKNNARAIIVLFTSSTRFQTKHNNQIVPYSIHSLDSTAPFSKQQLQLLKDYTAEFFDLDLAIYQNQVIIESVLHRLVDNSVPFLFDQGGFEHTSYGGTEKYFQKFDAYRSDINLWDYADKRTYRPYYHIKDLNIHSKVSEYYYDKFK